MDDHIPDDPYESLLTGRQAELLSDLAAVSGATSGDLAFAADVDQFHRGCVAEGSLPDPLHDLNYESLYLRWRRPEAKHSVEFDVGLKGCPSWNWILHLQDLGGAVCGELSAMLARVDELDSAVREVVRKTAFLHQRCEQKICDQARLAEVIQAIEQRLAAFSQVTKVSQTLDVGTVLSSPSDFGAMLDQLDGAVVYMETHYDFSDAKASLHQLDSLRNRACNVLRSSLQRSLERAEAQVEQQLWEDSEQGSVETQVFFTPFMAIAPGFRPLTGLVRRRALVHKTYSGAIEDLELLYASVRWRLLRPSVEAHLRSVIEGHLPQDQLADAIRDTAAYIINVSQLERQCFGAFFEPGAPQLALEALLGELSSAFNKVLNPETLSPASLGAMREAAECLQAEFLEPVGRAQQGVGADPALMAVRRLHEELLAALIARARREVSLHVVGHKPSDQELDYPALLLPDDEASDKTRVAHRDRGWYPTLGNTLSILAKTYRVLGPEIFEGLACEAVDACVSSLKKAASLIEQRPLPDPPHNLGFQAQRLDSLLFLIKHLLILKEQVAAFEHDDAVGLSDAGGRGGSSIDADLRAACDAFVVELVAWITQPLAVADPALPSAATDALLTSVRSWVSFAAAHIRVYLAPSPGPSSDGASDEARSMASSLLGPVRALVLSSANTRSSAWMAQADRGPDDLDGLFVEQITESHKATAAQLAEVVRRVPRAKPAEPPPPPAPAPSPAPDDGVEEEAADAASAGLESSDSTPAPSQAQPPP